MVGHPNSPCQHFII
jgi:hypothetical protein